MRLQILGCYAATPRTMSNPTAQVLEIKKHLFLIDCGEGTQVQLRKNKIKFSRIQHIFISHLHGDHFFGLPGLISTFRLLGRDKELHIYGPKGIKEAITLLMKLGNSWTNYPLIFHELVSDEPEVVYEDEDVVVSTIPLDHRIYTNGFLFREKEGERKLNIDVVREFSIDKQFYKEIKKGMSFTAPNGEYIDNSRLTLDPPEAKSYAYCSDTGFSEHIVPLIKDTNVLYHESTFLESEAHLSVTTKHSTAKQAATIAREAGVGQLILGHFSTRYKDIEQFKDEAREIFAPVELADDGKIFEF